MLLADLECHAIFFSLYFIFPFILKKKNQEHEGNVWDCIWHTSVAFRDLEYDNARGSSWFKVPCRHHISQHLKSKYSINRLNPETRTLKSFDLIHVPSKITIVYSEWFDFKSHETRIWNQFSLYAGNSWEVWTLGEIFRTSS